MLAKTHCIQRLEERDVKRVRIVRLGHNVELTGAARHYRAASSD